MLKALLTLVVISLFTGACLHVGWAEHPARLRQSDEAARAHWQASAPRAAKMQAGLAMLALLLGLWSFVRAGDFWLLAAGLLVGACIPWTLVVMQPLNRRLASGEDNDVRATLVRWGRLHHVRTALGLAAIAACLAAFIRP